MLDTCCLIAWLKQEPRQALVQELVATTGAHASWPQLAELVSWCGRHGHDADQALAALDPWLTIITPRELDFTEGGRIHATLRREGRSKLSLCDAVILAISRRCGMELLTFDIDLEHLPGARYVSGGA